MKKNLLEGFVSEQDAAKKLKGDYIAKPDHSVAEKAFKTLQDEQTGTLKEAIEDIESMIELRKHLSREISEDIEKIKTIIHNSIIELGKEQTIGIVEKQIDLEVLRVNEKLNAFRDIAALKKELREHMKELRELEGRQELLSDILEG